MHGFLKSIVMHIHVNELYVFILNNTVKFSFLIKCLDSWLMYLIDNRKTRVLNPVLSNFVQS